TYSYGEIEPTQGPYPTGRAIDLLVDAILKNQNLYSDQIGKEGSDWKGFTALPMLYPRNTSLYWHRDAASWTGSFTFYAHPEWNVQWGGELLVADAADSNIP